MENLAAFLAPLLDAYAGQYGWAIQIVSIIGTLRVFFKPIMAAVEASVAQTESKKDDIVLGEVKKHWAYKGFIFLIDLVGSIKIPKKK